MDSFLHFFVAIIHKLLCFEMFRNLHNPADCEHDPPISFFSFGDFSLLLNCIVGSVFIEILPLFEAVMGDTRTVFSEKLCRNFKISLLMPPLGTKVGMQSHFLLHPYSRTLFSLCESHTDVLTGAAYFQSS